jgi:dTDP-glucose 4,6-dehydratase
MSNILCIGGCSFIGSNWINHRLANSGSYNVIVNLDKVDYPGTEENIHDRSNPGYVFVRGSMMDGDLVSFLLTKYRIDTIVLFAAYSHVDDSFKNPISYLENNVIGTCKVLEASRAYGQLKKFCMFSTDEVYGYVSLDHPGCREDASFNPTNPYSASKAGSEMIANAYFHSFKIPLVTIRCNNAFGPNQFPDKLIPKFISLLKKGERLPIHGKGDQRRNFVHTEDIARAVDVVLEKGELGQVYNIGTEDEYSVVEIATMLIKQIKGQADTSRFIEYVDDRPLNDSRYHVNIDKITELGWKKQCNFLSKLKELY